jgi:acyl-[acyl carrier protein]--UDP-N-acetylglucosamine O-acyltransferase
MIHSTAIVNSNTKIGNNVKVGAFSIIHENVIIGDETEIGSHCEIGIETKLADTNILTIGNNSLIRSHSIFYQGSTFEEKLVTGHRVTVRENTKAGKNLQLGTLSDIQGDCSFGDYVRLHSNVHIGKKSNIGNFVWIYPYVVLTNDPHPPSELLQGVTVKDFAVIATMSVILPNVIVGEYSLIAAHACVGKNVDPHTVVGGVPAKIICTTDKIKRKDFPELNAYPWTKHFQRGYPEEISKYWKE